MKAIKNISEIMLAIEGARGPPEGKKRNLLYVAFSNAIILNAKRN